MFGPCVVRSGTFFLFARNAKPMANGHLPGGIEPPGEATSSMDLLTQATIGHLGHYQAFAVRSTLGTCRNEENPMAKLETIAPRR